MANKLQKDLAELQSLMNVLWGMFKQTPEHARKKMKDDPYSSFYIQHNNKLSGARVRLYWNGKGKIHDNDYFSLVIRPSRSDGEFDISSNSKVEFRLDDLDLGTDSPLSKHIKITEECIEKYNSTHVRTSRRTLNFSNNGR